MSICRMLVLAGMVAGAGGSGVLAQPQPQVPTAELVAHLPASALRQAISLGSISLGVPSTATFLDRVQHDVNVYAIQYSPGRFAEYGGSGTASPLVTPETVLSGLLVIPANQVTLPPLDTVLLLHGTVSDAGQVPSTLFNGRLCGSDGVANLLEAADCVDLLGSASYSGTGAILAASMGFAAVAPDGIGLGEAAGTAIPYLVAQGYAISAFAAHDAAKVLCPQLNDALTLSDTVLPAGYSEGGYAALALHKLAQSPELQGLAPWVPLSLPSGGPHNLLLQAQLSLTSPSYAVPAYIAFVATSFEAFFGVNAIDPAYTSTLAGWFDGTRGIGAITTLMAVLGIEAQNILSVAARSEIVSGDPSSELVSALTSGSVSTGWSPASGSTVHLCHGTADEVVFAENAAEAATLPHTTYTALGDVVCTSHTSCAVSCMFDTLGKLAAFEGVPDGRQAFACPSGQCNVRRGRRPIKAPLTTTSTASPTQQTPAGDCSDMITYSELKCAGTQTPCIELRGPALEDPAWSIPVVISAAHGGNLRPDGYAERDCDTNVGWICSADSFTRELSEVISASFGDGYAGKCPWVVVNHLHRSRLDANREVNEATGGNANATAAHTAFHTFIGQAQSKVNTLHGNDGSGIKGVMLDLHGYAGEDWAAAGSPYVQFGYRLSASTLQQDTLPDAPSGGLTHARLRLGADSLENLVRGSLSMGNRVPQVSNSVIVGEVPGNCGAPMPSPDVPKPLDLCASCHYYSGGYDLAQHEQNVVGDLDMNVMQIEVPRCIRGADTWYGGVSSQDVDAIRADYAKKLSTGLCGWLEGVFGETLC